MLGTYLTGEDPPQQMEKKLGDLRLYPISQPAAVWKAILTEDPYPIKAYVTIQGNPLSWSEDPKYAEQALRAVDFLVVMDYFNFSHLRNWPISCCQAPIGPSGIISQRNFAADIIMPSNGLSIPLFERKSDIWFMRELGRRIAPEWWPWKTDEELFDFQLKPYNMTWEQLREQYVFLAAPEIYHFYERQRMETPSGKVEIYSNVLKSVGGDPLPGYDAPPPPSPDYPLIAITGRRYPNFYHSAYRNISWLAGTNAASHGGYQSENRQRAGDQR